MKLDVPYYSQFADVKDPYWQSRACGMACLKMVLEYHGMSAPSLEEMAKKGKDEGGHTPSGWRHDYSLEVATRHGLSARREEKMDVSSSLELFRELLHEGEPIIVSVFRNFSEKNKFHQVVLTGFEEKEGALLGFYCHDPDAPDKEQKKHLFVPLEIFADNWRRMAIFIEKSPQKIVDEIKEKTL